jgi:hypothetical protein
VRDLGDGSVAGVIFRSDVATGRNELVVSEDVVSAYPAQTNFVFTSSFSGHATRRSELGIPPA